MYCVPPVTGKVAIADAPYPGTNDPEKPLRAPVTETRIKMAFGGTVKVCVAPVYE
jgi:hypothetical protein